MDFFAQIRPFVPNLLFKTVSDIIIPMMKTRIEGDRLIIRDQPFGFWLFYSFFIAGGLMALVLSLSAAPDTTTAIIGSVIGIGNITGGLYMVKREPASIVEIEKASGEVRVCRWYPFGKRQRAYAGSAITGVEVEISEHSEGGSVYRPSLCFGKAEFVPVSIFWYQTTDQSEAILREIRTFLGVDLLPGSVAKSRKPL
jgi:hypothetical protein